MHWSPSFIPTLRTNPAGETPSRQLLQRAGYWRNPDGWLPLAVRSMRKIEALARGVLDAAGGQEFGAPDGETLASLAREVRSYKHLPQLWYGVGPRLEVRRFDLKDGLGDLGRSILSGCGVSCEYAGSWVIYTEEGMDALAACTECRREEAMALADAGPAKPVVDDPAGDLSPEPFHTPGRKTIAQVAEFVGLPESSQMKSLALVANGAPVLVMLRGDDQLSGAKFAAVTGDAKFRPARADELFEWFGAGAGSLGPVGVKNMRILMDRALQGRRNMIAGANRDDYHLRNVTPGEDFQAETHDLRQAAPGDRCSQCGSQIVEKKAMQLASYLAGREAPDLHVTNDAGKEIPLRMEGCTVWLDRILTAIAITSRDEDGLILPAAIAPFQVVVTPANWNDGAQQDAAISIYKACRDLNMEALLDDRDERPGVKFKDADLIGIPFRVTVGKKLAEGLVEVVERKTKERKDVAADKAPAAVKSALTGVV